MDASALESRLRVIQEPVLFGSMQNVGKKTEQKVKREKERGKIHTAGGSALFWKPQECTYSPHMDCAQGENRKCRALDASLQPALSVLQITNQHTL